jgi:hypothetical protein
MVCTVVLSRPGSVGSVLSLPAGKYAGGNLVGFSL